MCASPVPTMCAVVVAVATTWLLPSAGMAIDVSIGPPNTIVVTAAPGERNSVTVTSDASGYEIGENGAATMTVGAGCGAGPGTNGATCPSAGISQLYITLDDGDDSATVATATNAVMLGGAGNDLLQGGGGQDTLHGEDGADVLAGGDGADTIDGGPGRDAVAYTTPADVTVRLDMSVASSTLTGDTDQIAQIEDVLGGDGRDTVTGSPDANALEGSGGEDYIDGRRGVDRLDGGASADVVVARDGAPDEPVSCGPGQDLAIVDRADSVARSGPDGCERVVDGSATKPRPGWVYVHPMSCGDSQAELGLPAMHRLVPLRYAILLASGRRTRAAPTLDAVDCPVWVRATPGQGRTAAAKVSGAAMTVGQSSGRRIATTLTVKGPRCAGRSASPRALPPEARLRVATDRRRGRWRVKGRFSIGAALGTDWVTRDGCSRTVTSVRRGRVRVFDRVKRRTVTVRAGHRYVAERGR
jgi:Ca2+-binding RTX toxin-like protein